MDLDLTGSEAPAPPVTDTPRGSPAAPALDRSAVPEAADPEGSAVAEKGALEVDLAAIRRLESVVGQVVRGKPEVIRLAAVSLLAEGHVLVEDVPGVGKTTLAHTLARALGLAFQRIQFTSDLLPSDIIGVSIYRQEKHDFELVPGPLFANVILADEINRATPKTQSALLEAMSERRVTVERRRFVLPRPFLVLATQNPLEYLGTFPLPESQLDRFMMSLSMGYPPRQEERALLLSGGVDHLVEKVSPAMSEAELLALQGRTREVQVAEKLVDYMLSLAEVTRQSPEIGLPVSTRGVQSLFRASQALALCEGRDYAVPDDVQRLAVPVLSHRITLKRGSGELREQREAIRKVLATVPVPL
ncbi:MAG: MoxR family ATPase [Holophagales bacterium]|nr:MoxR family ATPase [Holophagales bacterium]